MLLRQLYSYIEELMNH